jgi:hypothetical protein
MDDDFPGETAPLEITQSHAWRQTRKSQFQGFKVAREKLVLPMIDFQPLKP